MPTGRLERKITLGILEQFSTISQMCSNWFHFVSLAHLNSFKCRSNNETWRYKCVEGHAGGFYTRWQWAGGGDAGWEALIQNPKSQNTQGCEGSWAPIYCHARETFRAQNYFKRYLKYPQSMGLRSMDFVFRLETHLLEISLWDLCKYLNIWKKKKPKSKTHLVPKHFRLRILNCIQLLFPQEPGRESSLFIGLLCSAGDWTWVLAQDRHTHSDIPSLPLYLHSLTKLPWLRLNSLRNPERPWDDHPLASASQVAEITSQNHEVQFWGTCFSRILRQWGNYHASFVKWTLIMSSVITKTPNSELCT